MVCESCRQREAVVHVTTTAETKGGREPNAPPKRHFCQECLDAPGPECGILCFSTSRFDEMTRFLRAMGFVVSEGNDQYLPLFSQGRGARVRRGDFEFNLEEDLTKRRAADFDFFLIDLSDEEIARAKASGFEFRYEESLHGDFCTFKSPDGGTFIICLPWDGPLPPWLSKRLREKGGGTNRE